ncbi:Hypothetical protein, putative [Bodo saltans]|uniref:Uncharacterized protein n=1 Tax=Bodo saltans TaxID=75058 RepID=A0A0S4J9G7_BODSA|nr:Hypothetical protein, putative [Bodo saltans]|eukprot:CUG86888.1 Hypothetical protein, putative [Bodo saltans]
MALASRGGSGLSSDDAGNNRHRKSAKVNGELNNLQHQAPSEIVTPFPRATPQRGTELYTLLQHTKIDARTTSSKK